MSWNFGTRRGEWQVSDFDGKAFGGDIEEAGGPAGFFHEDRDINPNGIQVDDDAFSSGSVDGAFATDGIDPAAGVMGSFHVEALRLTGRRPASSWATPLTYLS